MRGHLRERSPGRWSIVLDVRGSDGKRKRKWHSFQGTRRQAQTESTKLIAALQGGTLLDAKRSTVGQYLEQALA